MAVLPGGGLVLAFHGEDVDGVSPNATRDGIVRELRVQ